MKITIKIISVSLFAASLLAGCSKKFLDLQPPSQIPTNEAILDENSMQTAVNGMYQSLRAVDLFGRTIPIDGDLLADNIYIDALQNSNRYLTELTYTYTATYSNIQNMWAEAYNSILRANNIINSTVPSSPVADQLRGEALTIRALCYFELVKFFGLPYQVDSTSLGVPLVLTYDAFAKPARNTVAEVYKQIETDLLQAYGLMTDESKNSSYVTKYVASALLARLYQYRGDWNNTLTWSSDVVNNGGYFLTDHNSLVSYWSSPYPVSNRMETIFEVEFDEIGNNGPDDLDAFYDQAGYGDALCTDNLYGIYSASDARQALIIAGVRAGQNVWVVNKYPNTTNPNGKDNVKLVRYAEVLLIQAEAYNRTGQDALALQTLNVLAQTRDPQFAGYSSSGAALLNDIYSERRKELAFEGHRYWDIVRLGQDVVRDGSTGNYPSYVPLTLPASSTKRIFPIPRAEMDANKNMVQNPGY
ncbi:MAG TPA: RagB/SusD family nutrient uptake outer membrane protein [Puia sp.]|nr:RagB/SusD family nutrient uptake outer membrane protein [Puia sp.]